MKKSFLAGTGYDREELYFHELNQKLIEASRRQARTNLVSLDERRAAKASAEAAIEKAGDRVEAA